MRPMPKSVKSAAKPESRTRRDKRNRIVDAAISVFAESGFQRARVSDIAAEAGIAYGLGCHYFKNKEEILNTIFEERWTGFLEAVENIADSPGSTEEKLVGITAMILGAYRVNPEWVKVLVLEIQRSSRFSEPVQIRAIGLLLHACFATVRPKARFVLPAPFGPRKPTTSPLPIENDTSSTATMSP